MSAEASTPPVRARALPWATGVVALAALGLQVWSGAKTSLEFDRAAIVAGELWRLWTPHLLHFSASHLGWNLVVLLGAGVWAERVVPRRMRLLYVIAPALIGVALLVFDPFLSRYAGLSGLAAGAVALLAFTQIARSPGRDRWFWWAVLALLAAKILLELFFRDALLADFGDPAIRPVPLAHIAGMASAALVHGTRRRFPL